MGPLVSQWRVASPLPHVKWTGKELVALRAWRLVRWAEDGSVRLASLSHGDVWHGPVFRADFRPETNCGAGIYAMKPAERPRLGREFDWLAGRDTWVWGWVALSGRVIEHERGYRAETAVIRQLRLGVQAHLRCRFAEDVAVLRRILEARYQCPVKPGYYESRKAFRMLGYINASGQEPPPLEVVLPTPSPGGVTVANLLPPGYRAPVGGSVSGPPRRKRQPPGTSAHGLKFDDVIRAFQEAERILGTDWRLMGKSHCGRVSLDGRYSRRLRAVLRCWRRFTPHTAGATTIVFPRAVVELAAKILRVKPPILIGREH